MTGLGPELDAARARVAARGRTGEAVGHLNPVVSGLSIEALGPVKQLLKRFFSEAPWTAADDEALADAIGNAPPSGGAELERGLVLVWGPEGGRFRLRVEGDGPTVAPSDGDTHADTASTELGETFAGVVVPEATPSPRTIRFATPPLHRGPSRTYDSAAAAVTDPRVARLFHEFDDVTNALVGPDFVAVTLARPDRWEALLASMLRAVTEEFTGDDEGADLAPEAPVTITLSVGSDEDDDDRRPRRLERAWAELGALRPERPEHLDRVLAAARDTEPARRQVAAALLADAPPAPAAHAWERLLADPSRSVRRSVIDAVADTGREELRPLLERALDDADPWARWKALRGIAALGTGPSRPAVERCATDPDFRVRLEATRALASA